MKCRADVVVLWSFAALVVAACVAPIAHAAVPRRTTGQGQSSDPWPPETCVLRMTVTVGDGQDAKPAGAGVPVTLESEDGHQSVFARTDREGMIEVDIKRGKWRAVKMAIEGSPLYGEMSFVIPPDAIRQDERFALRQTALVQIEGVLLNEADETPLAGISISVARSAGRHFTTAATTDKDGRFVVRGLWQHKPCWLAVRDEDIEGQPDRELSPEEVKQGKLTWKVRLLPPGRIVTLRLFLLENGKPVPLTKDALGGEKEPEPSIRLICGGPWTGKGGELSENLTLQIGGVNEDGICVLKRMTPGQWVISRVDARYTVRRGDKTPRESTTFYPVEKAITFVVPDGENAETTVDVVLSPEPLRFALRGTVLDASGARALEGASVAIQGGDQGTQELKTGPDGRFEVRVVPWVYSIRADKDGYETQNRTAFVTRDASIEFRLEQLFTLSGHLALPDGSVPSVAWAGLTSTRGDGTEFEDSDETGSFKFQCVRQGRYVVCAMTSDHPMAYRDIEIAADKADLDIRFEKGTTISGRVTFDQGVERPREVMLAYTDAKTGRLDGWDEIGPDGAYSLAVAAEEHSVYLVLSDKAYHVGKHTAHADGVTHDFTISKATLEKPLDRDVIKFR